MAYSPPRELKGSRRCMNLPLVLSTLYVGGRGAGYIAYNEKLQIENPTHFKRMDLEALRIRHLALKHNPDDVRLLPEILLRKNYKRKF